MSRVRLGDICDSCLGKMLDVDKNKGEYEPYLANINVRWGSFDLGSLSLMRFEEHEAERYGIKKGDLIICEGGEPGRCAVWENEVPNMKIQKALHRLRPHECLDVYYLYYWFLLSGKQNLLERHFTKTTIKHLTGIQLNDLEIDLIDTNNQKKIAAVLQSIDNKIKNNNKINETLQRHISLIYDYWFTQFDFPDENGKPYKSSGGKMVWNQKFKREVPEGWTSKSMTSNELLTVLKPGVDEFDTKLYLATGEVIGTAISEGNEVKYATRETRANMQPKINTVWFAKMKNSIKHLFLNKEMQTFIDASILSTGFCGLQCTNESFEYVSSFIAYSYFETIKDTLAHGATQEAVNNDDLSEIYMVIPNDKVLSLYHETTKLSYAQMSRNICENQELLDLRDWILPMLMNGQVTVN